VHWQLPSNFEPRGSEHAAVTFRLSEEAADTEVDTLSHLTAAHKMQIHFALVYFGVAPEFSETVEAQEAHAGMFDLVLECGRDDSILIPKAKADLKHGTSIGIYYAVTNLAISRAAIGLRTCWQLNYLLQVNSLFATTAQRALAPHKRPRQGREAVD
jgi:hypothetical protein